MSNLNIGFIGIEYAPKSCLSLEKLIHENCKIDFVISDIGDYKRKFFMNFWGLKSLTSLCNNKGIKHYKISTDEKDNRDLSNLASILETNTEVVICSAWHWKIGNDFLKIPKIGVYNCHSSLLPENAGGSGIKLPLLKGESFTGITLHQMTDKYDSGKIVTQSKISIDSNEGYFSLFKKISLNTPDLIIRGLGDIEEGKPLKDNNISLIYPKMSLFEYYLYQFRVRKFKAKHYKSLSKS